MDLPRQSAEQLISDVELDIGPRLRSRLFSGCDSTVADLHNGLCELLRELGRSPKPLKGSVKRNGDVQSIVVARLNHEGSRLLVAALDHFRTLSLLDAQYQVTPPGDDAAVSFDFQEMPFLDSPAAGIEALLLLRQQSPLIQTSLLRFLEAQGQIPVVKGLLLVNDGQNVTSSELLADLANLESQRSKACKDLSADLTNHAVGYVDAMSSSAVLSFPPLISVHASQAVLAQAGRCHEDFSSVLSAPIMWDSIDGVDAPAAESLWRSVSEAGECFSLMASWFRALAAAHLAIRCELCYRHRATKYRCALHRSSGTQTRDVRLAESVLEDYLKREAELRARLPTSELVTLLSQRGWPSDQQEIRYRSDELLSYVAGLAPIAGADLSTQLLSLAQSMVSWVEALASSRVKSRRETLRIDLAIRFLSLRGLWTVWCARDLRGTEWGEISMLCKSFDLRHPVVDGVAVSPRDIAACLTRQHAWTQAVNSFVSATKISITDVQAVLDREPNASLRTIARELGCSHTKVARVIRGMDVGMKRTHLKGYSK